MTTTARARRTALTAAVLPVLLLAGCGGTTTSASPTHRTTAARALGVHASGVIAYRRFTDPTKTTGAVWTVRPDGTRARQVTHPADHEVDDQPAISPDGRSLAYEVCLNDGDKCHVVVAAIDGSSPHDLRLSCPHGPVCDTQAPAWGPDGRLVVNRSWGDGASHDIIEHSDLVVVGADGSDPNVVATSKPFRADLNRPVWSPDGTRLAYEYNDRKDSGIRVVTIATGRAVRATPPSVVAGDGVDWSPDGSWLVFHTNEEPLGHGTQQVALVHPDGTGFQALTHFGTGDPTPLSSSFSPDGKWVVFGLQTGPLTADLYVVPVAGGAARRLTTAKVWESAPEWGPAAP